MLTPNSTSWKLVARNAIATPAEEKYAAIVKEARDKDGRAKIEYVHKRINGEIRYEPDPVQWAPRPLVFAC
ncbi:MAG: hypothetical protein WCA54_11830 [Pseudolabrys sp.]